MKLKVRPFGKLGNVVEHMVEKLVHGRLLQHIKIVQEHLKWQNYIGSRAQGLIRSLKTRGQQRAALSPARGYPIRTGIAKNAFVDAVKNIQQTKLRLVIMAVRELLQ